MLASALLLFVPVYLKSRANQDIPVSAAFPVLAENKVVLKITGEVRHPGIYVVSANILATHAINMAEPKQPLTAQDKDHLKTAVLKSGESIDVSWKPDGSNQVTFGRMTIPERLTLKIPLDISLMSEADFDSLPGIGPALAERIIKYRQNNGGNMRVDELVMVEGIGEKKFKELKGYFQHAEK